MRREVETSMRPLWRAALLAIAAVTLTSMSLVSLSTCAVRLTDGCYDDPGPDPVPAVYVGLSTDAGAIVDAEVSDAPDVTLESVRDFVIDVTP